MGIKVTALTGMIKREILIRCPICRKKNWIYGLPVDRKKLSGVHDCVQCGCKFYWEETNDNER